MTDVSTPSSAPQLRYSLIVTSPEGATKIVPIGGRHVTIGRSPDATVCIAEEAVSRQHCIVSISGGRLSLFDQGSTNGTKVNGSRVTHAWLNHGDVIQVGSTRLQVRARTAQGLEGEDLVREGVRLKPLPPPDQLALVRRLAARLAHAETIESTCDILLELAFEAFPAENGFVALTEDGRGDGPVRIVASRGSTEEIERTDRESPSIGSICREVMETGRGVQALSQPSLLARTSSGPAGERRTSNPVVCAPIRLSETVIGAIYLDAESMPSWASSGTMVDLLTCLADVAALAIHRVRTATKLMSLTDRSPEDAQRLENMRLDFEALVRERTEVIEEQRIELASRLNELEHLQQAQATMAASLVHDIKNLVSALKCNIAVAERELSRDGEGFLALVDATDCAQRIESMSLDVLDVSRMEDGSFPLATSPVDLNLILQEAIRRHLGRAREDGLDLRAGTIEDRLFVIADSSVVARVLDNLIDNALRYSAEGGLVEIGARHVSPGVEIVVRDTGAGVAPAYRDKIFDRWFQNPSGSSRHHGVGLYFCRLAVEAHGGSIRVEGRSGDNRFIVSLPSVRGIKDSKDTTKEFDVPREKKYR